MSGSSIGKIFKVTTWGESHGKALGVVIDGVPSGVPISDELIQIELNKRRPGKSQFTSSRNETDTVQIFSGIYNGQTTGTPISLIVFNKDASLQDYNDLKDVYRPGHADFTFDTKYGVRDYRGGGRTSGRETISRVAAGAVAKAVLSGLGISFMAYTYSLGEITAKRSNYDYSFALENPLVFPDRENYSKAELLIKETNKNKDSVGGIVECIVTGMPVGIGEPVFEKITATLGGAMFSIGGVKGVEFGDGFASSKTFGSLNNDEFLISEKIKKATNHSGGTLGGLSDGSELIFKVAFKPTSSIGIRQRTVNKFGEKIEIEIKGRHDPAIVPRAVIVVESMAEIIVLDSILQNAVSKMDSLKKIYKSKD